MEKKQTGGGLLSPRPLLIAPPVTQSPVVVRSVTRDEIGRYWQMKKIIEEDHLLAAEKAAAEIRAMSPKEEDYKRFEELLEKDSDDEERKGEKIKANSSSGNNKDIWIDFTDWWTKSKFAYLNQPVMKLKSMEDKTTPERLSSTYAAQFACLCNLKPAVQLYTSAFSIFG